MCTAVARSSLSISFWSAGKGRQNGTGARPNQPCQYAITRGLTCKRSRGVQGPRGSPHCTAYRKERTKPQHLPSVRARANYSPRRTLSILPFRHPWFPRPYRYHSALLVHSRPRPLVLGDTSTTTSHPLTFSNSSTNVSATADFLNPLNLL